MIEMLTKEQIEKIETLSFAKQKNMRVNAKEVTNLYNELFAPRKVSVTTCSTCIRRRIGEMENLLKKYREEQEKLNKVEEEVVEEIKEDIIEEQPEQEVEEQTEEIEEEVQEEIKEENKKKTGRPKKEEQKDDGHNEKVKEQTETAVEEGSTD